MTKSSRQIVYVEIDEEVTSVFDRIKNIWKKEIWLVIPRKAILFQSAVNLKILRKKLSEEKKKLIIVTTDRNGRHLAEKIGLPVMNRVEVEKAEAPSDESPQMKIQPIQAHRNIVSEEETPKRFSEKKISIRELIQEFRLKDRKHKKSDENPAHSFRFARPSRKFLILIMITSFSLFMLIGYIALPSATIYIRPKFDNIDFTVNVTLADKRKNQTLLKENQPHVIASEIINTTTKQTKIFNTASKEFEGKNATGTIKIVNTSDDPWDLKEGTRFQTDDGLVFRIPKGVIVPPREQDEEGNAAPGILVSYVKADPFDIYGEPIGERANIPATRFTIPGLSKYNQRLIWGESEEPMTGGVTSYRFVVTGDDIRSAEKQIENNLILMAKEDLRTYIDEMNKLSQSQLVLLDDSRYLKTNLVDLRYSEDLEGSYREKFEVFAKIEAEGVAFDSEQLFAILKKELSTRTHPDMRLREGSINQESITYEVIDEDELLGQIKITAIIVGIEEFDIDSSTVAGARFGSRVKEKILGLSIEEAENLVGNFSEVDAVEVKTWPLWINKIPRVPEGIEIKLMGN
ncbi:hypothetical protein KKA33_00690 [Patescibacteria group bacterium]|nr:hypothetical protein [Patescibacteria group bacterium]